MLYRHCFSTLF